MPTNDKLQTTVEAPCPTVRLIRAAGRLDRAAAAGVLRLVEAQLDLITAGHSATTALVIDLAAVSSFERGGLESLRYTRCRAARRTITVYLSGCGGRVHLLPLPARQLLTEFGTFPTAELAVQSLTEPGRDPSRSPCRRRGRDVPLPGVLGTGASMPLPRVGQ